MMSHSSLRIASSAVVGAAVLVAALPALSASAQHEGQHHGGHASPPNTLTPAEKSAGWELLFDGESTEHWTGFKKENFPTKGWEVVDGALHVMAGGGGGDIVTAEKYRDFELVLDWKASPGANSGIMYRVTDQHDTTWQTGPEYQILDDAGHGFAATSKHSAGALYDMISPAASKKLNPAGEWNRTKIVMKNGVVEHWLNDVKLLETDLKSDEWKQLVANSKFSSYEGFGVHEEGRIALQDHGNDVWFRNIKIRRLDESAASDKGERALFNGRNLNGWTTFFRDGQTSSNTFSVKDGILVCSGEPAGYIRTTDDFENYVLTVEWRWDPETKRPGNSGVLVRTVGEDKVWPKSIEAQLMHGNAGYLLGIGGVALRGDPQRTDGRVIAFSKDAEKPVGEWNRYVITLDGENITLEINGTKVNEASGLEAVPGTICLQSEGAPIHFRNITIKALD